MKNSEKWLAELGYSPDDQQTVSKSTFEDGGSYRIEIPSTETVACMKSALREADVIGCPIHRFSEGSGIQLMSDHEIREMARIGADRGIEVTLFTTPRASYDTGGTWSAPGGQVIQWQVRGSRQLRYSLDDIFRALDLGIRSFLLADLGLIKVVNELRKKEIIPAKTVIKASAVMAPANEVSAEILEGLGANSINMATDLSVAQLSTVRKRLEKASIDMYMEAPDGLGGFVRHHDTPDFIRYAAPVYVKIGLRNFPNVYPAGQHHHALLEQMGIEKVRRSKMVLDLVQREYPEAVMSEVGVPKRGVPEV
ncbi:MAG: hypothetical protein OEX02_18585 [Cyclobacteriaceae bacterium]|nr:hypothetical protein [Cyclobacteriaceae bacterium]